MKNKRNFIKGTDFNETMIKSKINNLIEKLESLSRDHITDELREAITDDLNEAIALDETPTTMNSKLSRNTLIFMNCYDYEGLYLNNKLLETGSPVNGGTDRGRYVLALCDKYDLRYDDISIGDFEGGLDDEIMETGKFPETLNLRDAGVRIYAIPPFDSILQHLDK